MTKNHEQVSDRTLHGVNCPAVRAAPGADARAFRRVWLLALTAGLGGCATAPPPVDLHAELAARHPVWRPAPVGAQADGRLVLGGVAGPSIAGVAAAGDCEDFFAGDLWFFPGEPEAALTVGWGDAPATLLHAPRPGCVSSVALLPGGIAEGIVPDFERREVFDTCAGGPGPAPVFTGTTGTLDLSFGVEGVTVAGLGRPGTYTAQIGWDAQKCGAGTVAVEVFDTPAGLFLRFSADAHQEGAVGGTRDLVEVTQLRLGPTGPVVLTRSWSMSTAWGEEGESEEVETGEASLGWIWGETAILRTEGWRSEKRTDEDCESWSLAEFGSWTLEGTTLDEYDELDGGESPECTQ